MDWSTTTTYPVLMLTENYFRLAKKALSARRQNHPKLKKIVYNKILDASDFANNCYLDRQAAYIIKNRPLHTLVNPSKRRNKLNVEIAFSLFTAIGADSFFAFDIFLNNIKNYTTYLCGAALLNIPAILAIKSKISENHKEDQFQEIIQKLIENEQYAREIFNKKYTPSFLDYFGPSRYFVAACEVLVNSNWDNPLICFDIISNLYLRLLFLTDSDLIYIKDQLEQYALEAPDKDTLSNVEKMIIVLSENVDAAIKHNMDNSQIAL